ncbi:MAG: hypothetical protein ACW967_11540 [Candidatus Hodarchaeales archaeon]|jgi:hypothetical protein
MIFEDLKDFTLKRRKNGSIDNLVGFKEGKESKKETFVNILSNFSHNFLFNITSSFHTKNEIVIIKIVKLAFTKGNSVWK